MRARADEIGDLVLDHDITHLLVRKNSLTDRKTQASIRCVPLLGVSLEAAQELRRRAVRQKSDWLMPKWMRDWQHLVRRQAEQVHAQQKHL